MKLTPVAKLTATYLAILCVICLFFSVNWYSAATKELNVALRSQSSFVEDLPSFRGSNQLRRLLEQREARLLEGKRNIARRLVLVNLFIVVLGGVGSYVMAKKVLKPIEEAHEAQSRFTADASHELRTPLTAMQTEIEVALRDAHLSKHELRALLQSNLEEVGKLKSLSEGLLALARLENDRADMFSSVAVDVAISSAIKQLGAKADEKHIHVQYDPSPLRVTANLQMVTQIMTILLDNALKYSPQSSVVAVTVTAHKHMVRLQVTDSGVGVAEEDLEHIFERFYQVDSSRSRAGGGYGLGLAIAARFAAIMGTKIEVQSTPGKGSTFWLELPRSGT